MLGRCVGFSTSRTGVRRELPDAAGTLHHAVHHGQDLQARAVVHRAGGGELRRPAFDKLGRYVLEAHLAESGQQVRFRDRLVVADGRRLALAVMLDPPQVLGERVGEARASPKPCICRAFAMPEEGLEPPTRGL